jgi:hypothetical protein
MIGVVGSTVSIRAALLCSAALLGLALPLLARAIGHTAGQPLGVEEIDGARR